MHAIREAIVQALAEAGIDRPEIRTVYAPAWTTDGWSEETREKLRAYGIAPPERSAEGNGGDASPLPFSAAARAVPCPYCDSSDTEQKSAFGSTPCKALHFCRACRQPFEHFKCH
jgi:ring-1,2-phenylacetyl-CoA epoxidase subunit PaaD